MSTLRISVQAESGEATRSDQKPPHQLILTGCPGSGKSYLIRKTIEDEENRIQSKNVWRTALHHESTFGDLVGSYKPEPWYIASNGGADPAVLYDTTFKQMDVPQHVRERFRHRSGSNTLDASTQLMPTTLYSYRPGPLILAYVSAVKNPTEAHVLIVEEINRANPAHVFGDLIQLLDRSDNGSSEYGITPSPDLARFLSRQLEDLYKGEMRLPENLYLWATMNRADETVSHMDTAFLRRWTIKYLRSDGRSVYDNKLVAGTGVSWGNFRKKLNGMLAKYTYVEADKYIGPYFLTGDEIADADKVFSKLVMYLWHDVLTMDRDTVFAFPTTDHLHTAWLNSEEIFQQTAAS